MRRTERDGSAAEVIVMAASLMPWWVCLILAFLSWAILHHIAGIEIAKPTGVGTMGDYAVKQMFVNFAWFGQIVLTALFILAAIISGIKSTSEKRDWKVFAKMFFGLFIFAIAVMSLSKIAINQHAVNTEKNKKNVFQEPIRIK
jgi:hypothetical protein